MICLKKGCTAVAARNGCLHPKLAQHRCAIMCFITRIVFVLSWLGAAQQVHKDIDGTADAAMDERIHAGTKQVGLKSGCNKADETSSLLSGMAWPAAGWVKTQGKIAQGCTSQGSSIVCEHKKRCAGARTPGSNLHARQLPRLQVHTGAPARSQTAACCERRRPAGARRRRRTTSCTVTPAAVHRLGPVG